MIFCKQLQKPFFSLSFFPSSSSSAKYFPPIFVVVLLLPFLVGGSNVLDTGEDLNNDRNGYVGCLFADHLCNTDEVCFDDLVFGKCVSLATEENNDDDLFRFENLSEDASDFLELELNKLKEEGFTWTNEYAQCIVQTALNTIRFNSEFDAGLCKRLLMNNNNDDEDDSAVSEEDQQVDKRSDNNNSNDEQQQQQQQQQQQENSEAQPIQKSFKVWTDNPKNPHALFYKSSFRDNHVPNYVITRQEDGGILIDPEQPDTISSAVNSNSYVQSYNVIPEFESDQQLEQELQPLLEQQQHLLPFIEHQQQQIQPFINEAEDLIVKGMEDPYKLFKNIQFGGPIEEEEEMSPGEVIEAVNEEPSGALDIETRALETPEQLLGLDESDTINRHKFGYSKRSQSEESNEESDNDEDEVSKKYNPNLESQGSEEETRVGFEPRETSGESHGNPEYLFIPSDVDSDERLIFNRNERLDVKKPGPFIRNSANNFFLNKIIAEEEDNTEAQDGINLRDPFGPRGENYNNDKGQIEFEQPLLAPVKDKRLVPVFETPVQGKDDGTNFVHIALNKRLSTWMQGSDLIERLAEEMNIPKHALTDRLIEDEHLQFRVEPNPQNLDADTMANLVGKDIEIQKRLEDQLGVNIKKIVSGHQNDFEKVLAPVSDPNLLLGATLALATTTVLVLSVLGLILIKRRRKQMRLKQNQMEQDEEDSRLRDQYSQLCRDWSTTTKPAGTDEQSTSETTNVKNVETVKEKVKGETASVSPEAKKMTSRHGSKELEESNRSSTSSWPDEPTTSNMDISTGHMVLAYMEDHLKNKQRLEQEWVALCGYEAEPCATAVAFKAENKKKNRYPDKLPYDHNRVILNALLNKGNSDYINASTVTDHDPRNPPYIVTQGPLSQTVADFWQMVWEQGCVVIVMLSRLQDNGYHLCHRYWPEEGSEKYHIFEVHLVSEHVWCDDYLVRSVYLKNTRTGETRTVTQFHFRSWPAQGVPSSTKALLEFRRKVNKSYRGRSCPIIVHCSDGVGRAGTYILIDMVLNRMAKGCKEIDIAATLEHIRDQRGGMVQTRQQFEFCLMAVAEEVHAILKALPQ